MRKRKTTKNTKEAEKKEKTVVVKRGLLWPFEGKDGWTAFVVTLVSFGIYLYTAAPNVTLLDSGELITAAMHFGVPHPTGYPLWTLGAWLFSLLPLGNAAWEVNIFSGVCGALAVGLAVMLLSNTVSWVFSGDHEKGDDRLFQVSVWVSWAFGLAFAMSVPMWTQSVIAEVYSMHALLVMLFVCALYRWLREPEKNGPFVVMMFFYALAWSNHHLILSLTPVPLILLVLLRKNQVWEFILYLILTGSLGYLVFAWLSNDPKTPQIDDLATWHAAIRFLLCALAALGVFAWYKKSLPNWKYGTLLILVTGLGFLPYLYMPFASSTNPPMNWGYTQERSGFFWSLNRSQYQGSLSSQMLGTVGKFTGAAPRESMKEKMISSAKKGRIESMRLFSAMYWSKIVQSYSFAGLVCFMFAFLLILRSDFWRRAWILTLFMLFILAAFLEPFFNRPHIDNGGWMLQMPYHTYSFALFAVVAGLGAAGATWILIKRFNLSGKWAMLWLAVPLVMGAQNAAICSQRGHWFGWEFGRKMLKDLPEGSVFLGGTDPGRFVPTYMILGESVQAEEFKRDPDFDRRDLYIITQNTLLDPFYLKYLRDQYTEKRPKVDQFERWLGRDKQYPDEPIILPKHEEVMEIMAGIFEDEANRVHPMEYQNLLANAAVAQWIFEKNKDKHEFYVEESFKMDWTYPYAVPHGLCYKISPEPLEELPADIVEKDMQFWEAYVPKLLNNPHFQHDVDAQRSFCKLRNATGNIYFYREMWKEAEIAWRQALRLNPSDGEALSGLIRVLLKQRRYDEMVILTEHAYSLDPLNEDLCRLWVNSMQYQKIWEETQKLEKEFFENPKEKDKVLDLMQRYVALQDFESGEKLMEPVFEEYPQDEGLYKEFINYFMAGSRYEKAVEWAEKLHEIKPEDSVIKFILAKMYFMSAQKEQFYSTAQEAIKLGGVSMQERFALDASFLPIRDEVEFQALLNPTNQAKSE